MVDVTDTAAIERVPGSESGRDRVPERTASAVVWTLALAVALLAIVLSVMPRGCARHAEDVPAGETVHPELLFLEVLERQPIDSLPRDVFGYETIGHQLKPGAPQAAEVVYAPMQMDVARHTPVRVYASAEAFPSAAEAREAVLDLLARYPSGRRTVLVGGVTPIEIGLTETTDAWVAAWYHGQYAIYAKAFFDSPVPNDAESILERGGMYPVRAIDLYQRTGVQGVGALEVLQNEGDVPDMSSGLGPPPPLDSP